MVDVPISCTSEINGRRIITHVDLVTANVVAGTGLFSDMLASLSDTFGGRSKSYQNQLDSICKEVLSKIREKAIQAGGNAVIGLKLDYSDISGQGKSMLMVSATGTAVFAEHASDEAIDHLRKMGKDKSIAKGQWRCRCGSDNDNADTTCSNCQRSVDAIN